MISITSERGSNPSASTRRRNAFIACPHAPAGRDPAGHEPVAFLICDTCGGVDEMASPTLRTALRGLVEAEGFEPRSEVLEITGLCAHCRHPDPA